MDYDDLEFPPSHLMKPTHRASVVAEDFKCPKCKAPMVEKIGKFGPFFGCVRFPSCKGSLDVTKSKSKSKFKSVSKPSAPARKTVWDHLVGD
jgi:ssDNA-binding Zn-finger/Zn-ribbon topoisomerase 1